MYDGGMCEFDQLAAPEGKRAKPKFRYTNSLEVRTMREFKRTAFFGSSEERADAKKTRLIKMPAKSLFRQK